MNKLIAPFLFLLTLSWSTFGQAPEKFNYQAVARDAAGELISNQTVSLQVSILDGSSTGTVEYTETHQASTNAYGLFTLEIGTGTSSDNFSDITWGDGDKFLQVEMDASGGSNYMMMGTSQLLSVPYALYAGNGSKWTANSNSIDYSNGSVGIGTENPKAKLEVADGDVYVTDPTKGIILKSPNGTCFRVTIDDSGNFVRSQITCPQ